MLRVTALSLGDTAMRAVVANASNKLRNLFVNNAPKNLHLFGKHMPIFNFIHANASCVDICHKILWLDCNCGKGLDTQSENRFELAKNKGTSIPIDDDADCRLQRHDLST